MRSLRLGWLVICGIVLLTACGGGTLALPTAVPTLAPTDTPAPTVAPTATPLPPTATVAPTATPSATDTPVPRATATPTQVATVASTTATPRPASTPTSSAASRAPLGTAPAGWKTYSGNARAPFSMYYPPNWTVDDSDLAKDGSISFNAPDSSAILTITADTARTTTSIDTLRDQYAKSLTQICIRSGVEGTDRLTLSNDVIFDDLVEVCDRQSGAQIIWLIGAGLNNGYPWTFYALSLRKDFSETTCDCPAGNLENYFAPMLKSFHIYGNPVG